jgi:hypothetical protein
MNAQDIVSFAGREECIDSLYAQEIVRPALHQAPIDQRENARAPIRLRSEHLEPDRSTVAPSLVREVALFI